MNTPIQSQTSEQWFDRLKVGQKIALGYCAVLGVVVTGTTGGIIVGNQCAQRAAILSEHTHQEVVLKHRLQTGVLQVRTHQQQLIPLLEHPEDFQSEYAHINIHNAEVEAEWDNLRKFVKPFATGAHLNKADAELVDFLATRSKISADYFQQLNVLVSKIDLEQLKSPTQLKTAQAQLLDFTNSNLALQFDAVSDDLVDMIKDAEQEEAVADLDSATAERVRDWTIALSIAASGAIATLLAWLISRSITRPLAELNQVSQQVIASENFDLRSTVKTQDEVGNLAASLNQLIEWVSVRTQALERSRDSLEQMVKVRTQELNAIIDSLGDGLLVTSPSGQIVRFNPTLLKMFKLRSEQLEEKNYHDVFQSDITGLVTQNKMTPAALLTADISLASDRTGQARVTAIADCTNQDYLGSVVLIRDITTEKEVDQMKTDFISTVSHELRTPLTSVLGFAKLIQKKLEDVVLPAVKSDDAKTARTVKQVRENLNIIIAEGDRLTSLINDVLDIAKIEAGKVEWNMMPLKIPELLERAIAATDSLAQASNLKIVSDIEADLPEVMGDRDRLIQVLINLLSNAMKFTEQGTVTCRARAQQGSIVISVVDQGIGIAPEDQPKVFEKFKQVGEVMTDKPKGTGLGLPICKQIIEHHNGQLWVESQLGQGSTFSFNLPLSVALPEATKINLNSLVQQLKANVDRAVPSDKFQQSILVVDDEPHIRELLRQELEAAGYLVRTAKDGIEALQQVKTLPPDLIILDVMMPNISGFDLAAVLKSDPATMNIPTIILSIIQDKEKGYRLGIDRYLSKPINTELLLNDIKTLLTQGTSHKKVLVVDADVSTTKTLTDVLLSKGYGVTEATTSSEGIEKALSIKPDMIIINADIAEQHNIVKTLRFDNGLENIIFIVVQQEEQDRTAELLRMTQAL
jgi:signal transduction histidine kinase/DNA-binding response OmpR family regulator/HAMP domain-containing protein